MSQSGFTVDIYQNEYIPEGGREVNAVVTVTSRGHARRARPAQGAGSAEIIIVDRSGSMGAPQTKIAEARRGHGGGHRRDPRRRGLRRDRRLGAGAAGLPPDGTMAIASSPPGSRPSEAVAQLRAGGGTAIGQWLRLAHQMFSTQPAGLRHAILLTDGKNQHETPPQLAAAIAQCEGFFSCDCRGVGTDWEVGELRRISEALLGTVDIVPDPAGLAADFAAMMETSMGKQVADVALRVWTPQHATLRFVKQVAPTVEDLTARRRPGRPAGRRLPDRRLGRRREPRLSRLRRGHAGRRRRRDAGRPGHPAGRPGEALGQGLIRAIWTDDEALSTRINPHVAHYTGQAELAQVIQEGLEARKEGDEETATAKLGRAVKLAQQSGNADTARLLEKVVDVVDAATGTVRLRTKVDDADEMALDTRSTKTVRTRK